MSRMVRSMQMCNVPSVTHPDCSLPAARAWSVYGSPVQQSSGAYFMNAVSKTSRAVHAPGQQRRALRDRPRPHPCKRACRSGWCSLPPRPSATATSTPSRTPGASSSSSRRSPAYRSPRSWPRRAAMPSRGPRTRSGCFSCSAAAPRRSTSSPRPRRGALRPPAPRRRPAALPRRPAVPPPRVVG